MAIGIPKGLNPNAPSWPPQQPTVAIWTPHYYQNYPLIPAIDYQLFCYFTPQPELHFPSEKRFEAEARVPRRMMRYINNGCTRKKCSRGRGDVESARDTLSHGSTVMIRNIPYQFKSMFMEFLDELCYYHNKDKLCYKYNKQFLPSSVGCKYDFVYLPMDFGSGYNLGYAFVNFTSSAAAQLIKETLDGYRWGVFQDELGFRCDSKKVCHVTRARIQGKANLIKRFQTSKFECCTAAYLPVILSPPRDGATTFPLPTTIGIHIGTY